MTMGGIKAPLEFNNNIKENKMGYIVNELYNKYTYKNYIGKIEELLKNEEYELMDELLLAYENAVRWYHRLFNIKCNKIEIPADLYIKMNYGRKAPPPPPIRKR